MKRFLFFIVLTILFIPVMVNAAQCDTSKVYIDSIGIENTNGNVVELENAIAQDKKVNLNLRMATKNDEILYKVVLKNDSTEDYEINKNSIGLNTDYLEYTLESDNNNIVKANSSRTIYLRVKYKTEVDPSKFVNGQYQDEVTMKVNLRADDAPANPNTGLPYVIIISLVLIISGIALIVYKKKKLSTLMILVGILLLPIGVNALCTCEIIVNSKVIITQEDEFKILYKGCFDYPTEESNISYKIGMSFNDFLESEYYDRLNDSQKNALFYLNKSGAYFLSDGFDSCMNSIVWPNEQDYQNIEDYYNAQDLAEDQEQECYNDYSTDINSSDIIKNNRLGAYSILGEECIG